MKNISWLLNRHVLAALCATPLLLSSFSVLADEAAPAVEAVPAAAVEAAAPAAPAEPAPPYTFTFNLGLYSAYMFRGVDYTDGPAIQGGADWAHSSGFYLGTWFSNLDQYGFGKIDGVQGGNKIETDFYGGYATTFGDSGFGINLLANYYKYFNNKDSVNGHKQDTLELSAALTYKWLTYTFFYIPTDYYGLDETDGNFNVTGNRNTDGATYNELKVNYTLPIGDLNFMAKVGYQHTPNLEGSQGDFAIGLNRNFSIPGAGKPIEGFQAGAYYTDTFDVDNEGFYQYSTGNGQFRDANEEKLWFYVKRTW
jgi:uncharacterized protein (TIGR02001 family)